MGEKHTPGPWVAEPQVGKGAWVTGSDGQWAALSCGTDDANGAANARLIASAPDLLASLRQCVDAMERQAESARANNSRGASEWEPGGSMLANARAAIARATGEAA